MNIEVRRITDPELWRECAEMTTGKQCKMSWLDMLKTGHSPIREQRYMIKFYDIPQFVTGHIIRHDKFANPFVQTKRVDKGGLCFRNHCEVLVEVLDKCVKELTSMENMPHAISRLCEASGNIKKLPDLYDREAPSSFAFDVNAEEIIKISKARLCCKASKETREIWRQVLELLEETDPDLVKLCKPTCVWNGFCRERKPCGYMDGWDYPTERKKFKLMFKK